MKHVTYADQSVLVGDEAADVLLRFAAVVADGGRADTVSLNAIASDGELVVSTFLIGTGTNLMAETTSSPLPEPNNQEAIEYMNEKVRQLVTPQQVVADSGPWPADDGFSDGI